MIEFSGTRIYGSIVRRQDDWFQAFVIPLASDWGSRVTDTGGVLGQTLGLVKVELLSADATIKFSE